MIVGPRLCRARPFDPTLNSNGAYWQASWTDETGKRCRVSLGPKAKLTRAEAYQLIDRTRVELMVEYRKKRRGGEPIDEPPPIQDGPREPNIVRIAGMDFEVEPTPWRLLAFMWGRDAAPVDDLVGAVWGDEETSDNAIKSAIRRVNNEVRPRIGLPWLLGQKAGYVTKTKPPSQVSKKCRAFDTVSTPPAR